MFNLSAAEMAEEPMEDFVFNMKISELFERKSRKDNAIMEGKAKQQKMNS